MAFEPGGYSDKLGNRYEGRWVVKQLLRLLNEKIHSIEVEPIGDDERGVDIIIERNDGTKQFQQCKARNASKEFWSIADLNNRGILQKMQFQLDRNSEYEFALVTGVSATVFGDICESARSSNENSEDYYNFQIQQIGETRRKVFEKFCEYLNLNQSKVVDRASAYDYLKRMHIVLWPDDQSSYDELLGWASVLVNGEPQNVVSCLADYAESNLRKCLLTNAVRKHLADLGFHPRKLAHDSRVVPAVEDLQRRFEESIAPLLVAGKLIPREETQELFKALDGENPIVLHGTRGYGKSGVLYELTHILKERGWAYLPVRLDRQVPRHTAREFGVDMGLPESPVICLKSLLAGKPGVLIIDQLDALRWTSSHTASSLDVCKVMVREVMSLRSMGKYISVVLSCRTFDVENDPEIKSWLGKETVADQRYRKIEVKSLPDKSVEEIVKNVGGNYEGLTNRQKQILSSPQHLAMWVIILQEGDTPDFQSSTQLMRVFWKNRYQELEKAGVVASDANHVLDMLVNYMEQNGKISAPASLVNNHQRVYTELQSIGIIRTDDERITFCHQNYLDFRIADSLLREIHQRQRNIKGWLGSKKCQSLFRREQLRQVLLLLCDESPDQFLNNVKEILESKDIRFHLKHLILEVIGQIEKPSRQLCDYLLELFADDYWNPHINETVFLGKPQYVKFLIDKAVVSDALDSDNEEKRNSMLWLIRSVTEKIPDTITNIISPYISRGGDWPQMVLSSLCWNCKDDSEAMFELRLQLVRMGIVKEFVYWKELAKTYPIRTLQLIEAVISTWDTPKLKDNSLSNRGRQSRLEQWGAEEIQNLKAVAINNPVYTWELLMPNVERLTAIKFDRYHGGLNDWLYGDRFGFENARASISSGIVELLCESGKKMASDNTDVFLERASKLSKSISPVTQQILITSYLALPTEFADEAINYLLEDTSRFNLGTGYSEPQWMPAVRLIEAHSTHCSDNLFEGLETAITHYHSPDEKRMAECYISSWKKGYFGDYWGRDQYFLLPALWQKRRSKNTNNLIRVLKRKFAGYSKERFMRGGRFTGGCVGSPLPSDRLEKISDKAWLGIINNKDIPEETHKMKQIGPDSVAESSVTHFANDLRRIAKRYPERFAQLALQFHGDVNSSYLAAILDGVKTTKPENIPEEEKSSWEPARIETIEAIIEKFPLGDDDRVARDFCWLIRERASENWSEKALNRLLGYAISHPDLEPGKLNVRRAGQPCNVFTVDDLIQNAINCIRGVAGLAIGALLWEHSDWLEKLKPGLEHLVNDPHPAVRVAALQACLPLLNIDKDLAVNLFLQACKDDLCVAACHYAVNYFNCCMQSHTEKLSHVVVQMFNSDKDEVAEKGAEEVCARWLFWGLFENELNNCRSGSVAHREGIAQVASHFVTKEEYTEKCKDLLLPLFDDENADVRQKTRHAFYNRIEVLKLSNIQTFIQTFIESQAFRDDPTGILFTFEHFLGSLVPYADVVFCICEQFTGPLAELSRDASQSIAHDASKITSLLLRLYEQSKENNLDISDKCLDAWDILFENRIGHAREMTRAIEL